MKDVKYGIWGGKFQIIQKGHEYVMRYVSNNYPHVCIGIINPNPKIELGSMDRLQYQKMNKNNPFTYFQRAYLWNLLLRYHSVDAVIVPHWQPHDFKLETTFLPEVDQREWILPPNMDDHREELEQLGERVHVFQDKLPELKVIKTSEIRQKFYRNDNNFVLDIPEKLRKQTQKFLTNKDIDKQFIIMPLIGDRIDSLLIYGGLQLAIDMKRMLIFAPVVEVQNEKCWWKYKPIEERQKDFFTFYQKHEIINCIMKSIQYYEYMVIPIFIKDGKCEELDAFFPNSVDRCWILEKNINFHDAFWEFRQEKLIEINRDKINLNLYIKIFCLVFNLYKERNYYFFPFGKDTEEKNETIQNISAKENDNFFDDLTDNVKLVLESKRQEKFVNGLKKIDKILKGSLTDENYKDISKVITNNVCSVEKKNSFLEKVLKNNIGNESFAAGVIVDIVINNSILKNERN